MTTSTTLPAPATRLTDEPSGTARLLCDLETRSQAEVEAVLRAASEEAARILGDAEGRCAAIRENAIAACEAEAAPVQAAARAAAQQAARRTLLEAQHAAVKRVLERVPTVAGDLGRSCSASRAVVAGRVADVLAYLGGEQAEIRCALPVETLVKEAIPAGADVRVFADPAIAVGVRASSTNGRLVVDDTLEAWLAREQPTLAIHICAQVEAAHA